MKIHFKHTMEVGNHIGPVQVSVSTDGTMGDCVINGIYTLDGDEVDMCFVNENTQRDICEVALQIFRDRTGGDE